MDADVIVVGAGLAGLVAAAEAADRGRRVIVVEQEGEQSLGGQAHWSFGGLFLVDSPEQRRLGVRDSLELARRDWFGSAQFDREEDRWPRAWADAYLEFAAGEKRAWLRRMGHRFFPVVGWAERGDLTRSPAQPDATTASPRRPGGHGPLAAGGHKSAAAGGHELPTTGGHGNSVPRFHITWGTGPGVVEPFARRVRQHESEGAIRMLFRRRVDELIVANGVVEGVAGVVLAPDDAERGRATRRDAVADFELRAGAVIVTSGGIGGDHALVRAAWPERLGPPPEHMLSGVPAHVDGRMLGIARDAGARVINADRMWHYVEGIDNWDPLWPAHGIRILPGPSSLWLDATGRRLPAPYLPGFDTLGTLRHLRSTGYDYSWFVLTQKIIEKEFALSGSEQNPDLTGRDLRLLARRIGRGAPGPVEAFKEHGADFVVADTVEELVDGMNALADVAPRGPLLDASAVRRVIEERDAAIDGGDTQAREIARARGYLGDRLIRVAKPHRLLDRKAGPLIAVKLHILSRKTLGGLETDLSARCLGADGSPVPGLYAAGEAAGFGGGGMMGYNALEGTFLGGCLFSGRVAGRAV